MNKLGTMLGVPVFHNIADMEFGEMSRD